MNEKTYSLCQTAVDLALLWSQGLWGAGGVKKHPLRTPQNSRSQTALCVKWAEQFEKQHAKTDWGAQEYLETLPAFFRQQYAAWLVATPARGEEGDAPRAEPEVTSPAPMPPLLQAQSQTKKGPRK